MRVDQESTALKLFWKYYHDHLRFLLLLLILLKNAFPAGSAVYMLHYN